MNNKGFTIVELLIMIGILALLSSVVFIDFGKNGKQFALERSAQKLAQDMRRVQGMAMGTLQGTASTTGYGIYLNKQAGSNTEYIVYRNENINPYYESSIDVVIETISPEDGISICDINDNNVSESDNVMSISFEPPDPITYIENNHYGHEAEISLCITTNPSLLKKVIINNSGRIEISE